ncbi:MAG: hypothetical protein ABSD73_11615 [Candidatus Bathyarchaeia archaeon]|jgi:hypothetical protein
MSVLQQVAKKSREYVLSHYGNLLSIDEPVFSERERLWKVKLKTDYPRLIKNDNPEERFVRTLLIKDIGTVCVNEEMAIVKDCSTSRSQCVGTLRTRLKTWEERAESIIVKTSAIQLAGTGMAQVFLNPIRTILSNFLEEETTVISFEELEALRENYLKWVRLLEELQLLRKEQEGYTYGNIFTEMRRKAKDDSEFLTQVLAYVVKERYPMLKEVFHLRQFETLVHLDSCYYMPALEAEKILLLRAESLFNRYIAQYRARSKLELRAGLLELCNSDALKKKNEYYFGNERLFQEMLETSKEFLDLSSPKI